MNATGTSSLAFLLLFCGSGYSASLSLGFDASTRFANGQVTARVTITNQGDESAKSVYMEALLGERSVSSSEIETLPVGASYEWDIELGPPPKPRGVYTVALRVHYTDIYGHPASGLHSIPLYTGDVPAGRPIDAELSSTTIKQSGELKLTLKAQESFTNEVTCRLILPSEVQCDKSVARLPTATDEPVEHRFAIYNGTALRGSRYRVFVVMDYVQDGLHASVVKVGLLEVAPYAKLSVRERNLWIAVIAVLLIAFAAAQLVPVRRTGNVEKDS
jgi:hypothetical protein